MVTRRVMAVIATISLFLAVVGGLPVQAQQHAKDACGGRLSSGSGYVYEVLNVERYDECRRAGKLDSYGVPRQGWVTGLPGIPQFVPSGENGLRIEINGLPFDPDPAPVTENGLLMVPMWYIFERLGASVSWDAESQTIKAVRGEKTITMTIGSPWAVVNGRKLALYVPPMLKEGWAFVPLRFVAEALGAAVWYDSAAGLVAITDLPGADSDSVVSLLQRSAMALPPDDQKFSGQMRISSQSGDTITHWTFDLEGVFSGANAKVALSSTVDLYKRGGVLFQDRGSKGLGYRVEQIRRVIRGDGEYWIGPDSEELTLVKVKPCEGGADPATCDKTSSIQLPSAWGPSGPLEQLSVHPIPVDLLRFPGGYQATRFLSSPFVAGLSSVALGPAEVRRGQEFQTLILTLDPEAFSEYLSQITAETDVRIEGATWKKAEAVLWIHPTDAYLEGYQVELQWSTSGEPEESYTLRMSGFWQGSVPIEWPDHLPEWFVGY